MEKNNLDKLYQSKLKNLDRQPDERVWQSIEASLNTKKRKKAIPLWWRFAGAAALLVVLLYIAWPSNSAELNTPSVTVTPNQESPRELKNGENDAVAAQPDANEPSFSQQPSTPQLAPAAETKNTGESKNSTLNTAVARTAIQNSKTDATATFIAQNDKGTTVQNVKDADLVGEVNTSTDTSLGIATLQDANSVQESSAAERTQMENVAKSEVADQDASNKKSIYDVLDEQAQETDDALADDAEGRWRVGAMVAPVYFDALGQGSPIDATFTANSKSGNVNLSYGLAVSYALAKRLHVRSGLHKVNYGYDTNDVIFSSSLQASANELRNINYTQSAENVVVQSAAKPTAESFDSAVRREFSAESVAPAFSGRMVQQLGFVEVPMELNYLLVDKKLGVQVIGGLSSLFLVDNTVSLESEGLVTELGEANNVNNVSFSTNIGLGINYRFSPKIEFNLEPMFKYQLNTFSNSAGDFRPYTVGVYSGMRVRF